MSLIPNKTILVQYSLLGVGAQIIQYMSGPETITSLWNKLRDFETINTYEKFLAGLTLLYSLGAIYTEEGLLYKNED